MADKEVHKKIPRLESRAPKQWDKIDRMYKYKQKGSDQEKKAKGSEVRIN